MAKVFERYKWLADLVQRSGGITFEEIQNAWDRSPLNDEHKPLSERTFHRHKEEIENVFNITIKCHKATNRYYVDNEDEVSEGGVTEWMLSTIAVDNMLNESRDLRNRIQFERIPGGREHLSVFINAMRDGTVMRMRYHNFSREEDSWLTIKPFFLKVYEQRWYVIGQASTHPDGLRTYALDRIVALEPTEEKFSLPNGFSPDDYFADCYGIYHSDSKPCFVKLKVALSQAVYLDTLPLHRTQRRIDAESTGDFAVYGFHMSPALDFVRFLASRASSIEVVEPSWLREEVAGEVKRMYETYFK